MRIMVATAANALSEKSEALIRADRGSLTRDDAWHHEPSQCVSPLIFAVCIANGSAPIQRARRDFLLPCNFPKMIQTGYSASSFPRYAASMVKSEQGVRDYARRMFERQGERASFVACDMIAHLKAIRDPERAKEWRRIAAEIVQLAHADGASPAGNSDNANKQNSARFSRDQRRSEAFPSTHRTKKMVRAGLRGKKGFWRRVEIELDHIRIKQ